MEEARLYVGVDLDRQTPQICIFEKERGDVVIAPMKVEGEGGSLRAILDRIEAQSRFATDDEQFEESNRELAEKAARIFQRALARLGLAQPAQKIEGITITVPFLSKQLVTLLRSVYQHLELPADRSWIQDHRESFYYHTLYQKQELWNRNVGFFHFHEHEVTFYALELNRRSRPISATVREGDTIYLEESPVRDEIFYQMILDSLQQDMYTSIFLLGEAFDKSWAARSTALLCKGGRKVYVVDNLFARGACYASREKSGEKRLTDYMYMGEGLVRKNIGSRMRVKGEEAYCQLIPAGVNWYEAAADCEVLLDGDRELVFEVSDMGGGDKKQVYMELTDLPGRPDRMTRLRLSLAYDSPTRCRIEAEDLGFGEFYPATGKIWRQIVEG